jgi:hypothetical protein
MSILWKFRGCVFFYTPCMIDFPKSAVRGSWKRRTFVTRKRAKFTGAFLLRWRQWMLINSELKQVTFLTTRTSTGSKVDVFHQSQPLTQSSDVTHAVRVVKNVTCLSSLLFCTNDAIWHGERPLCHNWFSRQIFYLDSKSGKWHKSLASVFLKRSLLATRGP